MKIVQVAAYYPPHIGGMETYTKEISQRLAKKGHCVEVFTSDIGHNKNVDISSTNNLTIHYIKSWEFAHTAIIPSLLFKLLKISKDSIIHVHIAHAIIPEIVFLVSKIKNIPYIAHIHADIKPSGKLGFLLLLYKKYILQKVLNSASKIVVPTKDYADLFNKRYGIPKNKILIIPPGVNPNNFKRTSYKLHDPVRLLFVGRLSKEKNVELLINVINKLVINSHQNLRMHIVGDGEENIKIRLQIKNLKLDEKVIMKGELRGKKLYEIYTNSDIFISTSSDESFGLVLIEAMSAGLPIVASNIDSTKNILKNYSTGLLVGLNTEEIVKGIEKLMYGNELRERLIKNGLEVVKEYDWDKSVLKFEDIYKN